MKHVQSTDPVSRLIKEFRKGGVPDLAERLQGAFWAGATGTECKGMAGNALREIVSDMNKAEFAEFRTLIQECEAFFRTTRPGFRVVPVKVRVRQWLTG